MLDTLDFLFIYSVRAFLEMVKKDSDATLLKFLKMNGRKSVDIMNDQEVKDRILRGIPTFLGRMGYTEAEIVNWYCMQKAGVRKSYNEVWVDWLYRTSGFFADDWENRDEAIDAFAELLISCYSCCDYICTYFPPMKSMVFSHGHFLRNAKLVENHNQTYYELGPYCDIPTEQTWLSALKGKKVLVVNSFSDSIGYQYGRKSDWAFSKECELPDVTLLTYKTYSTQVGERPENFKNYFEVLNKMIADIQNIDFDVALVGAGAYGFPLACEIKKMGKISIETCGSTPLFFGIYGERQLSADTQ